MLTYCVKLSSSKKVKSMTTWRYSLQKECGAAAGVEFANALLGGMAAFFKLSKLKCKILRKKFYPKKCALSTTILALKLNKTNKIDNFG